MDAHAVDNILARHRRRRRARWIGLWLAIASSLVPLHARGAEISVPITIDYLTLNAAIRQDFYTGPEGRAELWSGVGPCQFLNAENPAFGPAGTRVKFETSAKLALGIGIAGRCVNPFSWSGIAEAESDPYIAPVVRLKMRVVDLNLYNQEHQKTFIASKVLDTVKRYLIPRLEAFSYDLKPAIDQLGALAESASEPQVAERIGTAITSVRAAPEVAVLEDGLRITLIMAVPDVPTPIASATPTEPTPEEIKAFQKQLDEWDAFLVFAIKHLGVAGGDRQFRDQLLQILIESRYRLVDALGKPPGASGPDPVRVLFLDTWQRLGTVVRSAARRGQLGSRSLEFLSFISAGDALFAMDQAAPALGMRVSAADLRQLARIMAPDSSADPLQFNYEEDPELRKLFNVTEPLSSPDAGPPPLPPPATAAPLSTSPPPMTIVPVPSATPTAAPTSSDAHERPCRSAWAKWLGFPLWLIEPAEAAAAETDTLVPRLQEVATRLKRVVVDESNQTQYRSDMEQLLELSAARQLGDSELEAQQRTAFRVLVKSAAWQESCWRQFVEVEGRVTWLESSTGDIGLMQVNKRVWRGFYDLDKLRWDVLYNAGAGTEILMQLTQGVSRRSRTDTHLDDTALARSVYAAYNGGPAAYNRWRGGGSVATREIDHAFLEKFRAVNHGDSIDILSCAAEWGHAPGH